MAIGVFRAYVPSDRVLGVSRRFAVTATGRVALDGARTSEFLAMVATGRRSRGRVPSHSRISPYLGHPGSAVVSVDGVQESRPDVIVIDAEHQAAIQGLELAAFSGFRSPAVFSAFGPGSGESPALVTAGALSHSLPDRVRALLLAGRYYALCHPGVPVIVRPARLGAILFPPTSDWHRRLWVEVTPADLATLAIGVELRRRGRHRLPVGHDAGLWCLRFASTHERLRQLLQTPPFEICVAQAMLMRRCRRLFSRSAAVALACRDFMPRCEWRPVWRASTSEVSASPPVIVLGSASDEALATLAADTARALGIPVGLWDGDRLRAFGRGCAPSDFGTTILLRVPRSLPEPRFAVGGPIADVVLGEFEVEAGATLCGT